jgi:hypothetical protein
VLDAITMAGGLLCAASGLTVMAAWFARATAVLLFGSPHPNPMTFNSALAVAVTGGALVALVSGRPGAALAAGVFDTALGAVTLAERALGRGLGIDQLVVRAYLSGPHEIPGRPPVDSALGLTVIGAGLLVWGPWRPRRHPAVLAAAGSLVGAVAITAITGYATGAPPAYVWAHVTATPLLTAAAMLILAVCLLSAAWRDAFQPHTGLPRWLPLPAGAAAFGIAGAVWQAIIAGSGDTGSRTRNASAVLGLLMAGMVALVVWLAQQADRGRRVAVAAAARATAAETTARDGELRLFQFLDIMPVAVFIATPPASCSSPSSGCTLPASSPAPAPAWPPSSASSNAMAGASGPRAPPTAAPRSPSPSTRNPPAAPMGRRSPVGQRSQQLRRVPADRATR